MKIRSISRRMALLLAIVLLLAYSAPVLAEQMTVYTAVDDAIVYDGEGNNIGTLPINTALTLTGVKGGICQVTLNGYTAYMNKSELSRAPVAQDAGLTVTAYVSREGAKLYDAGRRVIATLGLNTAVTVTGMRSGVCQVKEGGREGYMFKADLAASPVSQPSGDDSAAQGVTAYVKTQGAKLYDASGAVIGTLGLNVSVTVTAKKNSLCKVIAGDKTGYMATADLSAGKVEVAAVTSTSDGGTLTPARGSAQEMDWWTSDIQKIFARGVIAQITDVETGLTWREKRFGGTNHADCQPLTAEDTAAMKKAYGGKWSWDRRAVFVTINGVNYAASINGMPHGGGSIKDNNFNGHHCIHFTNSRTHGTNKVCPLHQAAIRKAALASL